MDFPLFSQIPNAVLNKFGPDEIGLKKKKRKKSVKFEDESNSSGARLRKPTHPRFDAWAEIASGEDDQIKVLDTPTVSPATPLLSKNQSTNRIESHEQFPLVDLPKKVLCQIHADEKFTSDAIVQADTSPEKKTVACQTDESFLQMPPHELYEMYKNQIQAASLQVCRPLPRIRHLGCEPPLKLGLTKPKGKKRRVYYPGEND